MTLSALIRKGGLGIPATAIPATEDRTVAKIATIAVANPPGVEIEHGQQINGVGEITRKPAKPSPINAPDFTPLTAEQIVELDSGRMVAVLIVSTVLSAPLWLAFKADFNPGDGIPVFYADELELLKNKPIETLRKIYETKRSFGPGTLVRQ